MQIYLPLENPNRRYKCPKCDKTFAWKTNRIRHFNRFHKEKDPTKIDNLENPENFDSNSDLCNENHKNLTDKTSENEYQGSKSHLEYDNQKERYQCNMCMKSFESLRYLKLHTNVVHEGMDYSISSGLRGHP